jgi:hypothetical protein
MFLERFLSDNEVWLHRSALKTQIPAEDQAIPRAGGAVLAIFPKDVQRSFGCLFSQSPMDRKLITASGFAVISGSRSIFDIKLILK